MDNQKVKKKRHNHTFTRLKKKERMQLEGQKPVTCFRRFGIVKYATVSIVWLEKLKTVKHNKNFLNRPLELDHFRTRR